MSTRAQALAQGLKTYVTGKPCKRGHSGERRAANSQCVPCDMERLAAYYAANKEKASELAAAYYVENREKIIERSAAYYDAHREKVRKRNAANRENKREYNAAHYNREENNERCQQWRKNNPGAARAICAKRRSLRKQQRCTCCTDAQIAEFHKQAALCGPEAHVDHIVQLSLGGPDCAKNLVALTVEEHKIKTKLDAAARADSRRRTRMLLNWRIA